MSAAAWLAGMMVALAASPVVQAQTPAEFYKNKHLNVIVYAGAGSTYDIYARLLAKRLGDHIPGNPTIIVQNMVGAGGLKTVDYINRVGPKDGTVIGTIGRGLPFEPLLGKTEVPFDPFKFTWLGSMNREVSMAISWKTSRIKTLADLRSHDLIIPGTGAGADSEIIPLAINNLVGTRFKIINGYRDTTEAALAMERGELEGIGYWAYTAIMAAHPDWIRDKTVNVLFHTGVKPPPGLPHVPAIRDLVANATDRKALDFMLAREIIGRPFIAAPEVPPDRAKALQVGFMETLNDPLFRKDAETANIEINPVSADEIGQLLREVAAMPPEVFERVKKILNRS
jgi:tripartite-type tricarboxylate transporter receptor subunit TctC